MALPSSPHPFAFSDGLVHASFKPERFDLACIGVTSKTIAADNVKLIFLFKETVAESFLLRLPSFRRFYKQDQFIQAVGPRFSIKRAMALLLHDSNVIVIEGLKTVTDMAVAYSKPDIRRKRRFLI